MTSIPAAAAPMHVSMRDLNASGKLKASMFNDGLAPWEGWQWRAVGSMAQWVPTDGAERPGDEFLDPDYVRRSMAPAAESIEIEPAMAMPEMTGVPPPKPKPVPVSQPKGQVWIVWDESNRKILAVRARPSEAARDKAMLERVSGEAVTIEVQAWDVE